MDFDLILTNLFVSHLDDVAKRDGMPEVQQNLISVIAIHHFPKPRLGGRGPNKERLKLTGCLNRVSKADVVDRFLPHRAELNRATDQAIERDFTEHSFERT